VLTLNVHACGTSVGSLGYEPASQVWAFTYEPSWLARADRFALCPGLPLRPDACVLPARHSTATRIFFENLLPEGRALDEAAASNKLSKANSFGLLGALGRETAGALEILPAVAIPDTPASRRHVSRHDLAERIRDRPYQPFTVWDGRVRLSIAGYQDKLAVLEESGEWFLVEGRRVASTHLVKPEPLNPSLAHLTTNEHFCMSLARRVGLAAAATRLVHIPEPVLVVERFDRRRAGQDIRRVHCIDGCQALGLPVGMKYERPFGNGEHVRNIRDGANLPDLFVALERHGWLPARERVALLRWVIFQALIGNVDAHAKNLSFFQSARGLTLAPAYDLVCGLAYEEEGFEDTFAMAVGDEFVPRDLTACDWGSFAFECRLAPRIVRRELTSLAQACVDNLHSTARRVRDEGGNAAMADRICAVIEDQAKRALGAAPFISRAAA
jgi:serine/threonine-protein kinase HipA